MNYLPLNVLSGYTFLESGLKVEDIVSLNKDSGNSFCCICDDNNMYGYPLFVSLLIPQRQQLRQQQGCLP